MTPAAPRLRDALESFWRGRAQAELVWLRHGRVESPWLGAARFLFSEPGEELWQSSELSGELAPAEHAVMAEQRAAIAAELETLQARSLLQRVLVTPWPAGTQRLPVPQLLAAALAASSESTRELHARALADALDAQAGEWLEHGRRRDAIFASKLPKPPELGPWCSQAQRLLAATDDAAAELTQRALQSAAVGGEPSWSALLRALRRPELDGLASAKRRSLRLAAGLRQLGFERDLNRHMRAEPAPGLLFPHACLVVASVPDDVRVPLPTLDYGVASELYVSQSLASGLAVATTSPALPNELRRPLPLAAGAAFGVTYAQLRADPLYLQRSEGLSAREAEALARHAALLLLLGVRVQAALLLLAAAAPVGDDERLERLGSSLQRALGVRLSPGLAALSWLAAAPLCTDFVASLCGLACHVGLRERFDSDWFHNPRTAELLRGAFARGNGLRVEAFCTELDVAAEQGCARLLELLA